MNVRRRFGWRQVGWGVPALLLLSVQTTWARPTEMHIMEGFLPPGWAIFWFVVAIPFWIIGFRQIARLIGRNGSGKSTLLLHCNGILRPERGQVRVAGQPMTYDQRALRDWRRQVGLVFQHPDDQLFSANVAQDISFGPLNRWSDAVYL